WGMRAPAVAVGDGALGFWAAVRDVWPKTREQRDWFHKLGNILDKLPKRLQRRVKAALHEVMSAETRAQAPEAITGVATEYGAKYPKAVTTLEKDADALLTFFDFPAEHWKHLRTSNVIESPFATVRLRQRVTKGAGSRTKGLLMAYKLLDMAQARWRRLDGRHLLPLVRQASASWTGCGSRASQKSKGQELRDLPDASHAEARRRGDLDLLHALSCASPAPRQKGSEVQVVDVEAARCDVGRLWQADVEVVRLDAHGEREKRLVPRATGRGEEAQVREAPSDQRAAPGAQKGDQFALGVGREAGIEHQGTHAVLAAIRRLAQDPHTGGPDTDDRPFAKQEMRPAVRLRLATESRRQALDRIWQEQPPPPRRAPY